MNKNLLNLANDMQSLALVKHNYDFVMSKKKKSFISLGVTNIVGTSLIKSNSDFIAGI